MIYFIFLYFLYSYTYVITVLHLFIFCYINKTLKRNERNMSLPVLLEEVNDVAFVKHSTPYQILIILLWFFYEDS